MIRSVKLHIKGIVQGVGFRPFVFREAKKHLIVGWVLNSQDGVYVRAEGEEQHVEAFILALSDTAPAASEVSEIDIEDVPLEHFKTFEIIYSDDTKRCDRTLVSPDIATCEDCKRELFDKRDERYHYPFINCTNCGPRYTIIDDLPYDRETTSMSEFKMCEMCKGEYTDPENRRFHAQPNACFKCGPHIYLDEFDGEVAVGEALDISEEIIDRVVEVLLQGKIVAIKGLGGFHLACDANNCDALRSLRDRKDRDNKAFAVMMNTIDDAKRVCEVSPDEEAILDSCTKPIVLLKRKKDANLCESLVCNLPELGVMLPYTPLQMLIMDKFSESYRNGETSVPMLVMTSANLSDSPIITSDEEAKRMLSGICDCIVGNDREILTRFDDSVVRVLKLGEETSAIQMIRRARGYAPKPISLPRGLGGQSCLATGSEQRNTFGYVKGDYVYLSQHIGDMKNAEVLSAWHDIKKRMETLFDLSGACDIVCDKHPEYLSSKWAIEHVSKSDQALKLTDVQHHHAHIVAAMAENDIATPVIGFAFDGTGYGADGTIWGGEVLLCNLETYERIANFAYMPMVGGAAAIKEPSRMAYGLLYACDLLDSDLAKDFISQHKEEVGLWESMIDTGTNTPYTSSAGRLFDAVAALIGICESSTYEGEPAIRLGAQVYNTGYSALERKSDYRFDERYEFLIEKNIATKYSTALDTSIFIIDPAKVVTSILEDSAKSVPTHIIARRFHDALVNCVVLVSQIVERMYGIKDVALAGGVWMNRYLIESAVDKLVGAGFRVILNRELPPNDGSIAYGQAVVKCARDASESKQ